MPRRDEPLTYRSSLWGVFSATGDAATGLSISEKVLVEGETERNEEEETEEDIEFIIPEDPEIFAYDEDFNEPYSYFFCCTNNKCGTMFKIAEKDVSKCSR